MLNYLLKLKIMKIINIKNILKKIYYTKDLIIFRKKFKYLKNKNILLIGSGPNVSLENKDLQKFSIVCCNGSGSYLKKKNLKINPLLTIIDNELIDREIVFKKNVRSQIIKKKLLKDTHLGGLISVQSNNSNNRDPSILEANYNSFNYINKNLRRLIVNKVVNTNFIEHDDQSLLSTGIFTVSLCFYLGASSVFFTGFSLWKNNKDYFYSNQDTSDKSYLVRNHSLADSMYIALLKINKYKVMTNDRDFLPLMSNWGSG